MLWRFNHRNRLAFECSVEKSCLHAGIKPTFFKEYDYV